MVFSSFSKAVEENESMNNETAQITEYYITFNFCTAS
jgi:hypothetical protein